MGRIIILNILDELPQSVGDTACQTIETLQKNGYLPVDIKNPKTDENFSQLTEVCVERVILCQSILIVLRRVE